jgi:hypothetical protein
LKTATHTFEKLSRLLLLVLVCGCATPMKRVVETPPLPMTATVKDSLLVQTGDELFPPHAPLESQILWLVWDNYNDSSIRPYLITEIHSTTNLLQPFNLWAQVPPTTNAYAFHPTEQQRFFIARHALTNNLGLPWVYSDFSSR